MIKLKLKQETENPMKNSKGFTVIEGLLILVIIGLIGGTGWYVINARDKSNTSYNQAASVSPKTSDQTGTAFSLPKDWSWYINDQYKFQVAYPNTWGSPQFDKSDGDTGSTYDVSWWLGSDKFRLDVQFDSSDYVFEGCKDASPCTPVNGNKKQDFQPTLDSIIANKYTSDPSQPVVFHDQDSYITILTNKGDMATDLLNGVRITDLPAVTASVALFNYQLYEASSDCTQLAISSSGSGHCITQDTVDTLSSMMKSLKPIANG